MTLKTTVKPTVNLAEFDQTYRLEHEQRFTPERTGQEVDVLVRVLELKPLERVLDLGCGWGRHLAELKKRGFENLVGVDVQSALPRTLTGLHHTLIELARLLQNVGLTVTDVYGDWQFNPYTAESPRTLLITRKEP